MVNWPERLVELVDVKAAPTARVVLVRNGNEQR
jgi:hypothetical protein